MLFSLRRTPADKIKIAHVSAHLQFDGKENGLIDLVNGLNPDIFENYIFTFVKAGLLAERIVPGRCRIIEFGGKPGRDYRLCFKLAKAFRHCRIQIAHTHSWATLKEGIIGAKLGRVPIVIHSEHDTIKAGTRWRGYVQRVFWRATDQVLSVSEDWCEKLRSAIGPPEARIRAIANGVDLSRFEVSRNGVDYKARLGLPPETLAFGAIGRLVPAKAYPVLLKASKLVFNQIPHAYLIVVGEGPLYDELVQMAREYKMADRVRFLGMRQDVPEILKGWEVYVSASEREGLSNTILEAMASGLPVVATAVGGNPELVVNGETGLLVPPNHPRALAAAVTKLLQDPARRQKMGLLGRQRAEECFSLETMVRNYASLYLEMFKRRFKLNGSLREQFQQRVAA
jgi:sugar transferase (PEP-CTERM/EpsH1 system associated)